MLNNTCVTRQPAQRTRRGRICPAPRTVLARAVQWHCEDRVIVHENTTVVF